LTPFLNFSISLLAMELFYMLKLNFLKDSLIWCQKTLIISSDLETKNKFVLKNTILKKSPLWMKQNEH